MRALTRPLVTAALAGAALVSVPAQAAPPAGGTEQCIPMSGCDPFWLFRPCGPLIKCP